MTATFYDESYPPYLWTNPDKGTASDDDAYTDPNITAQDASNAAKLTSLGYVASPQTAWATGNGIYVNTTYRFYWTGTAWAAGLAPVEEPAAQTFAAIPVEPPPEEPPPTEPPPEEPPA